jgi:hypothetical protein
MPVLTDNHHQLLLLSTHVLHLLLQNEDMLGRSPEAVADFLAKTEGLNKTLIGERSGTCFTCQLLQAPGAAHALAALYISYLLCGQPMWCAQN